MAGRTRAWAAKALLARRIAARGPGRPAGARRRAATPGLRRRVATAAPAGRAATRWRSRTAGSPPPGTAARAAAGSARRLRRRSPGHRRTAPAAAARAGCSSTASTRAPASTRCRVSAPSPAPTSSTSWPGRTPASATTRRAQWSTSGCQPHARRDRPAADTTHHHHEQAHGEDRRTPGRTAKPNIQASAAAIPVTACSRSSALVPKFSRTQPSPGAPNREPGSSATFPLTRNRSRTVSPGPIAEQSSHAR
ncbi:hypothetical protein EV186_1021423 [Labedaea rhizosphaerae]|uniref:Uncharacterized protein n=1 Tax=Labedaea rhizosphaerae TaxID=598644 RepID=A0A4R6SIA5_LABRH|nr:hypothetical protein EV186_1021423 [Labedaea rhizosphaerae]